jgi:ribonuclease HI
MGSERDDDQLHRAERAMRATLHTDGAARHKTGEPTGPAGIGTVLRSESGEIIGEMASGIGLATNNVAEYTALIEGLQMALDAGITDIDVYIDSPVVAGHLLKGHRVQADHLRPLVERVRQLLDLFSTASLVRVPRALNAHADKLANQGIDDAIAAPSAQSPN